MPLFVLSPILRCIGYGIIEHPRYIDCITPSLDYFSVSSGDGRIKIWDTLKGQIQTEFANIVSSEATSIFTKSERGHLSIDYKCIKWLSFDKKKKRELGSSLPVLGTGSGYSLALDVSAGRLKWKFSDCHPGGVSAIAFANASCIYSAGADGMGSLRCLIFTEDGKLILSSDAAERYIAVWKAEDGKKQSACCILAMGHPADVETLCNAKLTKLSISLEDGLSKPHKGALPTILAAKYQGVDKPASVHSFLAHGFLVKPLFQKIVVQYGSDILSSGSQDGVLLPRSQPLNKSKKGLDAPNRVIALDRANAEDATLPIPKIFNLHEEKGNKHRSLRVDTNNEMTDSVDPGSQVEFVDRKDDLMKLEADSKELCMEDQLRSLGILDTCNSPLDYILFDGINLEANLPPKKMRAAISSMEPGDAHKLLEKLMLDCLSKIAKAAQNKSQHFTSDHPMDGSEDEDDDNVDDVLYGEEDESDVDDVLYGEEDES
ncbi:Transducin family protein / WD-40 repeat family protein, putative isoform 3 [Hibiscus syriacus]|uniref:Transducin family protein / WD-40 repeat family protein, putative isoform 3 n=1 Tax=Hibiscus syriacus TaxID=106335 RepID=A0A6A3A2H4_HIBSY|nr:Transducin family protein / WD-40 repeat family protein, putative isoform 3 [Hibiscus syriacus]